MPYFFGEITFLFFTGNDCDVFFCALGNSDDGTCDDLIVKKSDGVF